MLRVTILMSFFMLYLLCANAKSGESVVRNDKETQLDSIHKAQNSEATNHFYQRLRERCEKRQFTRWLYKALILSPNKDTLTNINVIDETNQIRQFEGKRITSITTQRGQVFDQGGNIFEQVGNKTHILTRDRVVRRDLLFGVGDTVNAALVVANKYLMRSRSYIYDADIIFKPIADDTTAVEMIIQTRDNWSLSANISSSLNGNTGVEVFDANILGMGNKLSIETNFNWTDAKYGGNVVEYEIPNIMGTFFRGKVMAGRNFKEEKYGVEVLKNFIKPTDYELGFEYSLKEEPYYLLESDTSNNVQLELMDVWSGFSNYLPSINSSIYLTGLYGFRDFSRRPTVSKNYNPFFHDRRYTLIGLGLYREKFYTSNLIYGYGFKEYIPAGYKIELVSGYNWGEFYNSFYFGLQYRVGGFSSIGHLTGGIKIGGSVNPDNGDWSRNSVDMTLRFISNLIGRSDRGVKVRQFATLNYTHGWNRDYGADEMITFNRFTGPRGINEYVHGINRMVFNTETVLFTPLQPLGCRMAFFAFADAGLLGYKNNPFQNEFFATAGIGVRLKNERLVFSTLEVRLGLAFGKHGMLNADYVTVSSLRKIDQFRYTPTKPEAFLFK